MKLAAALILSLVAAAVVACGEASLTPIPRVTASPGYICEGDAAQRVELDGSDSRLPDGSPGDDLEFDWHLAPEPEEYLAGDLTSSTILARFSATRPVRARLVVTAPSGQTAEALRTVGLTRTERIPCGDGCEDHELCVTIDSEPVCVQDYACYDDDDCGDCLLCLADGGGTKRCVEPGPSGG